MTAVTLTAGNFNNAYFGYSRPGGSAGVSYGTISAEPLPSHVLDYLSTNSGSNTLYLVGDTSALPVAITIDGVSRTLGPGNYSSFVGCTTYNVSGAGFSNGVAYTVDIYLAVNAILDESSGFIFGEDGIDFIATET